ncbi:MAG: adenine deaminase [Chlamydiales bacterium]
MLVPSEFARLAVIHGTVATVSDPHEIANVLGIEGVRYMIANSKKVPFHFFFGAPSCVPATSFETAGASITLAEIEILFKEDGLLYLSEMMNYPGVLNNDPEVMKKIALALQLGRPVDGHAPGLKNEEARFYAAAGITTDHECFTLDEALDKIACGMKILIREGSAAKNFDALHSLFKEHADKLMLCSDDMHPDKLTLSHINALVRRAVKLGYNVMDVLYAACIHPIHHYGLNVGQLRVGDPGDFIIVNNLEEFRVKRTYIGGQLVAQDGVTLIESQPVPKINHFTCSLLKEDSLALPARHDKIHVIEAIPGELITRRLTMPASIEGGIYVPDPSRDLLKLVVINRYKEAPAAVAFIKGMGLREGAIASSVAHDSHNVIAVGADDKSLCQAINAVISNQGGVCTTREEETVLLPLPVAGLMSCSDSQLVAKQYIEVKEKAKALGSTLPDPFMTLSFMALLVIPSLKLSDLGLFDAEAFQFIPLEAE